MSRLMPRKRTILGGVLVAGIGVGLYLSGKLPHLGSGFGLGSGGDGILGKPDVSHVAVQSSDSASTLKDEGRESSFDKTADQEKSDKIRKPRASDKLPPDDVLTVLVDEHDYAVWKKTRGGNGYFPTALPAIVEMALKRPANPDGLRVRVVYTQTARYPAWHALQQELLAAGIPARTIELTDELVE